MRLHHYILLGLIMAVGLGASFWLIPRESEIALMHFKDGQDEIARKTYEEQLTSGPLSVSIVRPLTELYLEFGDIEEAVALMERFVRQDPANMEALRRLATYYKYAQRPAEYLFILEQISRLQSSEGDLRELSDIYDFEADYNKQIATLKSLIESNPGNPKDFLDLANLQASRGQLTEAAATMQRLEIYHPQAVNEDTVELLLSLMLDTADPEPAFARASGWLSEQPDPEIAARFASLFHYKGEAAFALRLLEPFREVADQYPQLLAELTQVEIATGLSERAFARLKRLYLEDRLPDIVFESFVDLSLAQQQVELAFAAVQDRDLRLLPDWLLVSLASAAVSSHHMDFARQMVQTLGEGFLEERPVLAAEIALARGEQAAAERWIAHAERANLSMDQKIALAGLYGRIGRRQDAFDLLVRLASSGHPPDTVFGDLAEHYLTLGKAAEGLVFFERLRSRRFSPSITAGWARLAATEGHAQDVIAWLHTAKEREVSDQLLSDLYYISMEGGQPSLALASAERLYRRRRSNPQRLLLANALVAAGRPGEALPHLRSLLPVNPEAEAAYANALSAALAKGEPVREESRRFWKEKLARPDLTEEQREEAVYALLDLNAYNAVLPTLADLARRQGDPWLFAYVEAAAKAGRRSELIAFLQDELDRDDLSGEAKETRLYALMDAGGEVAALPYLRRLADTSGGNWVFAYEEALDKLGRRDELMAFWKARAARTNLPAAEKRALADRMLEAGQKEAAERVLLALAGDAPPDSRDVSQLLFLWGPRPSPSALDWLQNRARSSSGERRAGWIKHLVNSGAARRAIAVVESESPPAGPQGAVLDAYLDALVAAHDGPALSAVVGRIIGPENNPRRLRRLARLSYELGQQDSAWRAYGKLLALLPDDPESLQRLGALAFYRSDYSLARRYLSAFLAGNKGDYESNFYYGESLLHQKDRATARIHYERALRQIDLAPEMTFAMRVTRALLLHRIGRKAEALAAFELLLGERPDDKNLRADYAGILLDEENYALARRILSTP